MIERAFKFSFTQNHPHIGLNTFSKLLKVFLNQHQRLSRHCLSVVIVNPKIDCPDIIAVDWRFKAHGVVCNRPIIVNRYLLCQSVRIVAICSKGGDRVDRRQTIAIGPRDRFCKCCGVATTIDCFPCAECFEPFLFGCEMEVINNCVYIWKFIKKKRSFVFTKCIKFQM